MLTECMWDFGLPIFLFVVLVYCHLACWVFRMAVLVLETCGVPVAEVDWWFAGVGGAERGGFVRWRRVAVIVDWGLAVLERDAERLTRGLGRVRGQIRQ